MSGRDDKDDAGIEDALIALEEIAGVVRDNQDVISGIFGGGEKNEVSLREPLSDAQVEEDKVVISMEMKDEKPEEMGVKFDDGIMVMNIGEKRIEADVPDDIIKSSVEASMNNGVLRVEVSRETGENMETTEISYEEESIEPDDEDGDEKWEDEFAEGGDEDGSDE